MGENSAQSQSHLMVFHALKLMARNNRLISCLSGIYIAAPNQAELELRITKAIAAARKGRDLMS
jgi:hypothetical protein